MADFYMDFSGQQMLHQYFFIISEEAISKWLNTWSKQISGYIRWKLYTNTNLYFDRFIIFKSISLKLVKKNWESIKKKINTPTGSWTKKHTEIVCKVVKSIKES